MNKLTDLIGNWQPDEKIIDEMMQEEQEKNGTAGLNEGEKTDLLNKVLEKANIPNPDTYLDDSFETTAEKNHVKQSSVPTIELKNGRIRKRRLLPAILVAILTMATISFAAVTTMIDPAFLTYLKPSYQEQIDAIQNSAILLGQEDRDNGYTIRARQAIGDKNMVYVLFDLIAEDENVLNLPYYGFSSYDVKLKDNFTPFHTGMGYSFSEMEDENPNDNVRTFLLELSSNQSLLKKNLQIQFENICTYLETEPYEETLVSGKWELNIPLDYKDASITTHPLKKISLAGSGKNALVTTLRISPISITINAKGKGVSLYDSAPQTEPIQNEIEITLKDGSKVGYNSSGTHSDGITFTKDQSFSKIIDLREIESIRYMGAELWH
ncbi:DUF4179 domain-containing protein [Anaerovorax sp. IOR16]|uniref:DUF4179 domain-containing protein n=1 Tax=Anaerovorax sp. IOR16 TaxID=2773458 RepID=UPI0019D31F3F|nr:DUF4179 domain-containing protein [Anaerovorax sp. IOR16]